MPLPYGIFHKSKRIRRKTKGYEDPSLLPIAAEAAFNKRFVGGAEDIFQNWIKRNAYYQLKKINELPVEQKLIDFKINIIKQQQKVSNVWSNVCPYLKDLLASNLFYLLQN